MKINRKQQNSVNGLILLGEERKKFIEKQDACFDILKTHCPDRKKYDDEFMCQPCSTDTYVRYCRMVNCHYYYNTNV